MRTNDGMYTNNNALRQAAKEWIKKWEDDHNKKVEEVKKKIDIWFDEYEKEMHRGADGAPDEMNIYCEILYGLSVNPKQDVIDAFKHFFNLDGDSSE